ncbi:hypothetical protein [Wolbachia endosymbiont of Armadillidium arcangelii]|uniref:Uncharacterized protein n=1 Tax=Wolbachia endosymbiont of Armadillidium arcangelii TaxID=3158571 RepID=A0AAU7Q3N4_9RICK
MVNDLKPKQDLIPSILRAYDPHYDCHRNCETIHPFKACCEYLISVKREDGSKNYLWLLFSSVNRLVLGLFTTL